MGARRKRALTEAEWDLVFRARCKSKQGQPLTAEEQALVNVAYTTDVKRYGAMEREVFNATVPFGSSAEWKK